MSVTPDPVIERWQADIARIASEVIEMHHNRNVYNRVMEIAVHGDLPSSAFFSYLGRTYGMVQVAAVRRQADVRKDSISLHRLLEAIWREPTRLTRERFLGQYAAEDMHVGSAAWYELFAGQGGEYVDRARVKADLADLTGAAKAAKHWADHHVAHLGRERADRAPTVAEVDGAIDTIGAIFKRYNLLLLGGSYAHLAPAGVKEDLTELFRQAWIRSS